MARQLRRPLERVDFDDLKLTAKSMLLAEVWWNLRWEAHLTPGTVFHASKTGRLTPGSGIVKCLYIAAQQATCFHEIYGDDLALAKESGTRLVFSKQDMVNRIYATTPPGLAFKVYDLTTMGSARKIGMDLATLYTGDVEHPRRFAQRLHDHPEKFDGIRYLSRHTQGPCIVLWPTHSPALAATVLMRGSSLWDHATYGRETRTGSVRLFGENVGVAAP